MAGEAEEKFHELEQDSLDLLQEAIGKMAMPFAVQYQFIGNKKQKALVRVSKITDVYSFITGKQVLISVNDDYLHKFDDEARDILMRQELDRLQVDINSGKVKIAAPELSTSVGVLKKFGIDAVQRATQLETLYAEQKADAKTDDFGLNDQRSMADLQADFLA